MIDRVTPTRRPPGRRPINYQDWRMLLFLHWPVRVEVLRPLVPASLEIDTYDGVAYVGVVPFIVRRLRPPLTLSWFGLDFLECNTRTYVHRGGHDPGVYFFSLDAASRLAVGGARVGFGLPYFHASMRLRHRGNAVEYLMQRHSVPRPRFAVHYELGELLGPSPVGSLEHFLLERYLLHVERGGVLQTVQVHHHPYPAQRARVLRIRDELLTAAGLPEPAEPPPLVHYAAGVDVEVFAPSTPSAMD